MKSLINILAVSLILALIGMIFYLVYQGTLVVWTNIDLVDHTTKVILGSVGGLVLLFACLMVYGLRSAAGIGARSQLSDQRYGLYVHVLTILRNLLEPGGSVDQRQVLMTELKQANADFLLVASAPAIKAYLAFQEAYSSGQEELLEACFQSLWKKLRKDLGFSDDFDLVDIKQMIRAIPVEARPGEALIESQVPATP